jgi:hypothetical protein
LKTFFLSNFLKAPELKLPSAQFSYRPFSTSEIETKDLTVDFPSKQMLGKQAEYIFEHYVKNSKRYRLVASNIQIQGVFETLGELDYILFDSTTHKHLHIELACKFYLLDESLGAKIVNQWIGPNRKDRLLDKLEKFSNKQFPLLHQKETAQFLEELELKPNEIEQQVCLKAFLFLPKRILQYKLPQHYLDCVIGFYIRIDDIHTLANTQASYALPGKKEWLLPPTSIENWFSFSEVREKITESIAEKRSLLVYKNLGASIEKIFVVWW